MSDELDPLLEEITEGDYALARERLAKARVSLEPSDSVMCALLAAAERFLDKRVQEIISGK